MAREIPDSVATGDFPPMVGLRNKDNYVKGTVTAIGTTTNGNPVATLTLIDLEGSTSISKGKGVYEEVEVAVGDSVQVVGSHKRLKEKLPQLAVGDVVTITNMGKTKLKQGQSRYEYKVIID